MLAVALFLVGGPIVGLLTDARWFESLGAGGLFWTRLQMQGSIFAVTALATLAVLLVTLILAGRLSRDGGAASGAGSAS